VHLTGAYGLLRLTARPTKLAARVTGAGSIDLSCEEKAAAPASRLTPDVPVIVSVCITCKPPGATESPCVGARMFDATRAAIPAETSGVVVRAVQCLGVCKRPATVAVSAPNGFTFVFGDLNLDTGPAAVATFVAAYRAAEYGFVPWRARPQPLRGGLVARIPASTWSPDDGHPPA
jgi:predicted metal-binding protein